ncbi:MAG TPA: rhomboid family intramembrane serine protease [Polyangiaceae bacterium]
MPGPVLGGLFRFVRESLGVEAPMTRLIIGLQLLVFGLCLMVDGGALWKRLLQGDFFAGFRIPTLVTFGALGYFRFYGFEMPLGVLEPWRLLSAVFVHVGFLHIAMNLFTFADLGRALERGIGSARFVVLFVLSGILGFLASEIWYEVRGPPTAGASGGVFGQIGAVVGILYSRRDPEWRRALTRYLIFAVLLGLLLPVNTPAHLGGFFAGILLGFLFHREQVRLRLHRLMTVLAGLCLLASVVSVALSVLSPNARQIRDLYEAQGG